MLFLKPFFPFPGSGEQNHQRAHRRLGRVRFVQQAPPPSAPRHRLSRPPAPVSHIPACTARSHAAMVGELGTRCCCYHCCEERESEREAGSALQSARWTKHDVVQSRPFQHWGWLRVGWIWKNGGGGWLDLVAALSAIPVGTMSAVARVTAWIALHGAGCSEKQTLHGP